MSKVVDTPMQPHELISPEYLDEQKRLHAAPRGYGQRGFKWEARVTNLALNAECRTVLDYGCGQGSLGASLQRTNDFCLDWKMEIREYDPAISGKDALPEPADLVVCTDVMEHVEGDKIIAVIRHLSTLTIKRLFLVVSLVETAKTLTDGRQAHISLYGADWWRLHFGLYFDILEELPIKTEKQWVAVLATKHPTKDAA